MNRGKSKPDDITTSEGSLGKTYKKNYPKNRGMDHFMYHQKKNSTSTYLPFEHHFSSSNKLPYEGESSIENQTNTISNNNHAFHGVANSVNM